MLWRVVALSSAALHVLGIVQQHARHPVEAANPDLARRRKTKHMTTHRRKTHAVVLAAVLTEDELEHVVGGMGRAPGRGGIPSPRFDGTLAGFFVNGGVSFGAGPYGGGADIAITSEGKIYGDGHVGFNPRNRDLGFSYGVQAGVIIPTGNHTANDVMAGDTTSYTVGPVTLGVTDAGYTVGLGKLGLGISGHHAENINERINAGIEWTRETIESTWNNVQSAWNTARSVIDTARQIGDNVKWAIDTAQEWMTLPIPQMFTPSQLLGQATPALYESSGTYTTNGVGELRGLDGPDIAHAAGGNIATQPEDPGNDPLSVNSAAQDAASQYSQAQAQAQAQDDAVPHTENAYNNQADSVVFDNIEYNNSQDASNYTYSVADDGFSGSGGDWTA